MPTERSVAVNVEPNEVVLGGRPIEVRAPAALDAETARAVIALTTAPAQVALSRDKRTATLEVDGGLPPGPHTLRVGELVSARGERLSEPVELPFFVERLARQGARDAAGGEHPAPEARPARHDARVRRRPPPTAATSSS